MKKITPSLGPLEKLLGYKFKNKNKLIHALTHSSHKNEFLHRDLKGSRLDLLDNERLEFFGDAVLSFVICKKVFREFPEKNEGHLSKYRSLLVSRGGLFTIAKKLKLHHYLRLGKSENALKLKEKTNMMADALEAIIAAIYFDRGMRAAETFILRHFGPYLDIKKLKRLDSQENYKSLLQEYTQKGFHVLPRYKTVPEGKSFTSSVHFRKQVIGIGKGKSKREAEKKAAKAALQYYKKNIKKKK